MAVKSVISQNAKLSNVVTEDLTPVLTGKYAKLVRTSLRQEMVTFRLTDVHRSIANGLRRTISGELPCRVMYIDILDIEKDDPFLIHEMIRDRVRLVPISQAVKVGAKFTINVANKGATPMDVYAESIKGAEKMVDGSTRLFELGSGRIFRAPITIREDYGFNHAAHRMASNVVSIPLDQKPFDIETGEGVPSSKCDPRQYEVRFIANGAMSGKDMIKLACDNIISRMDASLTQIDSITSSDDVYQFTIDGETDTIGKLYMDSMWRLYPDIGMVTTQLSSDTRSVTIRIKCEGNVKSIIESTAKYVIGVFNKLRAFE